MLPYQSSLSQAAASITAATEDTSLGVIVSETVSPVSALHACASHGSPFGASHLTEVADSSGYAQLILWAPGVVLGLSTC